MKARLIALALAGSLVVLAGCSSGSSDNQQQIAAAQVKTASTHRTPYVPHNNVEFNNYNKAQQLYDDPSTIIWCTAFPNSSTEPIVTVPIAGKLTSSATSYFQPEYLKTNSDGSGVLPSQSVDGMYHVNPAPYRYGFTPGGQYVDFTNIPTVCTTQPMSFQRQSISVTPDKSLSAADSQAQKALQDGNAQQAQQILEQAAAGQ